MNEVKEKQEEKASEKPKSSLFPNIAKNSDSIFQKKQPDSKAESPVTEKPIKLFGEGSSSLFKKKS